MMSINDIVHAIMATFKDADWRDRATTGMAPNSIYRRVVSLRYNIRLTVSERWHAADHIERMNVALGFPLGPPISDHIAYSNISHSVFKNTPCQQVVDWAIQRINRYICETVIDG